MVNVTVLKFIKKMLLDKKWHVVPDTIVLHDFNPPLASIGE
jgi:hypothetical protein